MIFCIYKNTSYSCSHFRRIFGFLVPFGHCSFCLPNTVWISIATVSNRANGKKYNSNQIDKTTEWNSTLNHTSYEIKITINEWYKKAISWISICSFGCQNQIEWQNGKTNTSASVVTANSSSPSTFEPNDNMNLNSWWRKEIFLLNKLVNWSFLAMLAIIVCTGQVNRNKLSYWGRQRAFLMLPS